MIVTVRLPCMEDRGVTENVLFPTGIGFWK